MNISRFLLALLASAFVAHADELMKNTQTELKSQGFYYGEITGVNSPETAAAIKRYQIRNGLEVTGSLNKETLDSLGTGADAPAANSPPPLTPPPPAPRVEATPIPRQSPPANLRRDPGGVESDREYLKRPPQPDESERRPPPPQAAGGGREYGRVFSGTPYSSAPLVVQQDIIRKAQKFLRNLNFYKEDMDGQPSPSLEEGLLAYQRFIKLPLTGHLDMETLSAMRLLPGRGGAPARPAGKSSGKPLRGVWVE
jgi:peptidoglycan hydrolase-like protein with peptidoglycan-binding domain